MAFDFIWHVLEMIHFPVQYKTKHALNITKAYLHGVMKRTGHGNTPNTANLAGEALNYALFYNADTSVVLAVHLKLKMPRVPKYQKLK